MCSTIPPLVPSDLKEKMVQALSRLEDNQTLTLGEIEETMISFGYELWPWNQAFKEFLISAESKMGEHFILPKLSGELLTKYEHFKHYGGTFRDLHSGRPADYFSLEERCELRSALVEIQIELREFATREVLGVEKTKYIRRVEEFKILLQKMRNTIEMLFKIANAEQDHPTLVNEIKSKTKHFEHSLCLLGSEIDYEAIDRSLEFFQGRREELNRLKGIHLPSKIVFEL